MQPQNDELLKADSLPAENGQTPLFINRSLYTRRHMQKVYQAATPRYLIWILAIACVMILISFGSMLYLRLSGEVQEPIPTASWLSLCYILLAAAYFLRLRSWLGARRYEKVNDELHPGRTQEIIFSFYEDHGQAVSNLSAEPERAEYISIIRVKETKEHLLLFRRQRLFYHLDKAGFEKGDSKAFIAFLQEKIPSAQFHLK